MNTLFEWYGKRTVVIVFAVVIVLTIAALFLTGKPTEDSVKTETALPTVQTATAGSFGNGTSVSLIGTVEAIDEAVVQSEAAGRVVRVAATLGQAVQPGTLLVQLESAAEQAAVLQAEGSYEAALAASAQSTVSVEEANNTVTSARNAAINTVRNAFTTNSQVVRNNIDDLLASPESAIPGVLVNGAGYTQYFNTERVVYQTLLPQWQTELNQLSSQINLEPSLQTARDRTEQTVVFVNRFIETLAVADADSRFSQTDLDTFQAEFLAAQATLNNTLQAIDTASTNLVAAKEALARAEIGASNPQVSAADAQVKQALGALNSARASLAKKTTRAPIAGSVNSIDVQVGDFLANGSQVAVIANNDALEITAFAGEQDAKRLSVGTTVLIDDITEGTVTTIAPAVNAATGKIEIKIQATTDTLLNGDTVTIAAKNATSTPTQSTGPILVPITAVKFTATAGAVFTVADGILVRIPVEVGSVIGSQVQIIDGISTETAIVTDARGLSAGASVEAISQ